MIYSTHILLVFEYLQTEHTTLRKDLLELVTENRCLSDKLKDVMSTKITAESTVSPYHKKKSDMLSNLQQQLCLTAHVCSNTHDKGESLFFIYSPPPFCYFLYTKLIICIEHICLL